jgi:hypothetical protein
VIRADADLLRVRAAVDDADEEVPDRLVEWIDGDPRAMCFHEGCELAERQRLVVGHLREPDVAEPLTREPLDQLYRRSVADARRPDRRVS